MLMGKLITTLSLNFSLKGLLTDIAMMLEARTDIAELQRNICIGFVLTNYCRLLTERAMLNNSAKEKLHCKQVKTS